MVFRGRGWACEIDVTARAGGGERERECVCIDVERERKRERESMCERRRTMPIVHMRLKVSLLVETKLACLEDRYDSVSKILHNRASK